MYIKRFRSQPRVIVLIRKCAFFFKGTGHVPEHLCTFLVGFWYFSLSTFRTFRFVLFVLFKYFSCRFFEEKCLFPDECQLLGTCTALLVMQAASELELQEALN